VAYSTTLMYTIYSVVLEIVGAMVAVYSGLIVSD
jgi:hypothetical protein